MTPAQIHEIGLERSRAHPRRDPQGDGSRSASRARCRNSSSSCSTDKRFSSRPRTALLAHYRALEAKINQKIPEQFSLTPKAPFEIRPVEPFRAKSAAGGEYQRPSEDGTRPGIFYVNTYDLPTRKTWDVEDLYLHEAIPGHHFQLALQQELTGLPKFRRFGGETAFSKAGACTPNRWARSSASTPIRTSTSAACRTSCGARSAWWSTPACTARAGRREQVIKYMLDNSAESETQATAEAERYIAMPGQALAYKIGELKIQRAARPRREGARRQVRRARIPRRSAEGRLGAAGRAGERRSTAGSRMQKQA